MDSASQGANRYALTYSDIPRAVLDETFHWHGCGAARFNLILPLPTHAFHPPSWPLLAIVGSLYTRAIPPSFQVTPRTTDFPHGTGTSLRCNTRIHSTPLL